MAINTFRNIGGAWSQSAKATSASLTTALAGSNNDIKYTAVAAAASGNSITVRYVVSGNNTALSVSVSGNAITVNVATDGSGNPTSTATQVRNAVNGSGAAAALVSAALASGNDGSGVVAAMSATALTGGISRKVARGGSAITTRRSQAGRGQLRTN